MDEANKTVAIASARSHQHRWRGSPEHKTIVDLARTSLCCKLRWIANICEHLTAKHLADATSDDRAHLSVIMRSGRRAASRWRFAGSPRCASSRSFWKPAPGRSSTYFRWLPSLCSTKLRTIPTSSAAPGEYHLFICALPLPPPLPLLVLVRICACRARSCAHMPAR